jgi:hypothetical protein
VDGSGGQLRPTLRSVDRSSERLAGRLSEEDSLPTSTWPAPGNRSAIGARRATRPLAFVAVYTDAIRLTTPGTDDSL